MLIHVIRAQFYRMPLIASAMMLTTLHFCLTEVQAFGAVKNCVDVPLSEIFNSPHRFNGKLICTKGYYHNRGEPVLHTKKILPRDKYYLHAMLLDADDNVIYEKILDLRSDSLVSVKGVLSVPEICWHTQNVTNEEQQCVPFKKPVDLQVTEIIE